MADDLLGLLFKAITTYCQSPAAFISFPDSLVTGMHACHKVDVTEVFNIVCISVSLELSELPSETNSNQLTLSKAAFLQGGCGLVYNLYLMT